MSFFYRNLAFKGASDLTSRFLRLLLVVLAARELGQESFGLYIYSITLGLLCLPFTDFGLHVFVTREVARGRSRHSVTASALRGKLFLTALAAFAILGWAVLRSGSSLETILIVVIAGNVLVGAFTELFNSLFRGLQRLEFEAISSVCASVLMLLFGWVPLALGYGLAGMAIGLLTAGLLGALGAGWLAWRVSPRSKEADFGGGLSILRRALPIGLAGLFSALYFRMDILMIDWLQDAAGVGVYGAAYRLIDGVQAVPAVVMAPLFPLFTERFAAKQDIRGLLARFSLALTLAGVLIAFLMRIFGEPLIELLYGPEYAAAAPVLGYLALAIPLLFLNYGLTHFLIGLNLERLNVWLCSLCVILNFGLNLAWIPRFGLTGAALATVATEILLFVGASLALWCNFGVSHRG